jgi:hypothetical protein
LEDAKQKLCHRGEEDAQLNQSLYGAQLLRGDFVRLSHGGDFVRLSHGGDISVALLKKRKKIKIT